MQPETNGTNATPRRQSCDRCYNQKLRCKRPENNDSGFCERCRRTGSQCTYSLCLPKGRPSLYRSKKTAAATETPSSNTSSGSSNSANDTMSDLPATLIQPDLHPGDIPHFAEGDSMSVFADFPASTWPEDHMTNGMLGAMPYSMSALDPTLEAQSLTSTVFSLQSTRNDSIAGQGDLNLDAALVEAASTGSRNGNSGFDPSKNDLELSIAHLSRLNTRLSQLLGSSRRFLGEVLDPACPYKSQDPPLQVQLGIETIFKSINIWLVHGSANVDTPSSHNLGQNNACDLLHHVFSASNHLLEILHHIRINGLSNGKSHSTTASSSPRGSTHSGSIDTAASRGAGDGGHHFYLVVHQLVLVCVTLLLNIYLTILIALQRSADALSASLRHRAVNLAVTSDHMDAALRTNLQLVSVVQMCSYFIKRQNHALDMMMLSNQGSLHAPSSHEYNLLKSASPDAMSEVKIEVEQRLRRLQESLCINA